LAEKRLSLVEGEIAKDVIGQRTPILFSKGKMLMKAGVMKSDPLELDDYVEAFELARSREDSPPLLDFLPDEPHPQYQAVLSELIRVDLELSWQQGQPKRVEDYQPLFPELFQDSNSLRDIAFEEYRLRRQAGENPCPAEYRVRFGLPIGSWPKACKSLLPS
jgi:hypothetical protein